VARWQVLCGLRQLSVCETGLLTFCADNFQFALALNEFVQV